jgi:cell division protein FtsL
MSVAVRTTTTPRPPVLTVRRPLVSPTGDPRRLLRLIRNRVVRRVLLLVTILAALCLTRVWVQLQVVDLGYQLSAAQRLQQRLDQEHRELQAELAMRRDPAALAAEAQRRLGLVPPVKGQVVEVR